MRAKMPSLESFENINDNQQANVKEIKRIDRESFDYLYADGESPPYSIIQVPKYKKYESKSERGNMARDSLVSKLQSMKLKPYGKEHDFRIKSGNIDYLYRADFILRDNDQRQFIISVKLQDVSGTTEKLIVYEDWILHEILKQTNHVFHGAYVVCCGSAWKKSNVFKFYPTLSFNPIISEDEFLAIARRWIK